MNIKRSQAFQALLALCSPVIVFSLFPHAGMSIYDSTNTHEQWIIFNDELQAVDSEESIESLAWGGMEE